MTAETLNLISIVLTVVVLVTQALHVYLSLTTSKSVSELKVYMHETFVTKTEGAAALMAVEKRMDNWNSNERPTQYR